MKYPSLRALCLSLAAVTAAPAMAAETATSNLGVTAVVANSCTLTTTTAVSFLTIDPSTDTNETTPGVLSVLCTTTQESIDVKVGGGLNPTATQRRMVSGSSYIPYSIYSNAGRTAEVGLDGTLYNQGVTALVPQLIQVYGKIPSGDYSAGAYSDTLLVTLSY